MKKTKNTARDYAGAGARLTLLMALFAALPAACTYDADHRCGPHELLWGDSESCVCEPTAVYTANGCVPCGENEVPGANVCVCIAGYSRSPETGVCTPPSAALGSACNDTDKPCTDPAFNFCATSPLGERYCTISGCQTSADCSSGYSCDLSVSPSVCRRPPTGLLQPCTGQDDCAGTEATYCEGFGLNVCVVQGCSFAPDDCFEGWQCCDLTSFAIPEPICVPKGYCFQ